MNNIIKEDIQKISDAVNPFLFENKTVLITGANGLLPSYIVEYFVFNNQKLGLNIKVIGLVRTLAKGKERFKHYKGDSCLELREHNVQNQFEYKSKIDFIIHAASKASPIYYGTDPISILMANTLGTINMLKLAQKNNCSSFLFFSSGEVYGETSVESIGENDFGPLNPTLLRSCYSESKRMGENSCVSWYHQYGVKTKIVRPFHTYGPGINLNDGRVFADFVSNAVDGKNITIKSDGLAVRSYCYLSDATEAFLKVLVNGEPGNAYNVGNPESSHSVNELAEIIKRASNIDIEVVHKLRKKSSKEYIQSPYLKTIPNIQKIKSLGWSPSTSALEGFKRTIRSFK